MASNVIKLRGRTFTWAERQLLMTGIQVWSEFTLPHEITFGLSDEGDEYAVVINAEGRTVAHIGFTPTQLFVDGAWYGYLEYSCIDTLIHETMPKEFRSKYCEYKRKLA